VATAAIRLIKEGHVISVSLTKIASPGKPIQGAQRVFIGVADA
jgi:hypothetical protein